MSTERKTKVSFYIFECNIFLAILSMYFMNSHIREISVDFGHIQVELVPNY